MKKTYLFNIVTGVTIFLFSIGNISWNITDQTGTNQDQNSRSNQTQTKTKSGSKTPQTKPKTTQKSTKKPQTKTTPKTTKTEPVTQVKDTGFVVIGTQKWEAYNLNVSTFRNGDSIPQAKSNKDWIAAGEAGKPAWCYYNNNPAIGKKYGKLYNWYAVTDPRGLAPEGWVIPKVEDWMTLAKFLKVSVGAKMKSITGWSDGYDGTNESGFKGYPGGFRVENGAFMSLGGIGIWWSSTENKATTATDHYLAQNNSLSSSSSPKSHGESVRCLKK